MTSPIPLAPGVIADVSVLVISVDTGAGTAVVRVIDNNGVFLSPNATLPVGVVRPVAFPASVGDVLEEVSPAQRTGVVRWVDTASFMWSEAVNGAGARPIAGWKKIGVFPLP